MKDLEKITWSDFFLWFLFYHLGKIPLRHLVYRVHAIPESMRSLVWDFGQLNPEVEELYTQQIVRRYVSRCHCRAGKIRQYIPENFK